MSPKIFYGKGSKNKSLKFTFLMSLFEHSFVHVNVIGTLFDLTSLKFPKTVIEAIHGCEKWHSGKSMHA